MLPFSMIMMEAQVSSPLRFYPTVRATLKAPIFDGSSTGGQCPGDPWEKLEAVLKENEKLKNANQKIQQEYDMVCIELQNLRVTQDGPGELENHDADKTGLPSDEATRKRLERLCKKNAQG